MSQGWKKIQATLLARARAEKKAVEEARNASTMDKKGRALLRVVNDSVTVGTGFVDPIDLKKPHGRH
jgi:hypothetical protein